MKNILLILCCISFSVLSAQRDWSQVEITPEKITENIYVLYGAGGNMGLAIGADHAYLIDDQFAPLTDKILAAVRGLTSKPLKFVVNTHRHGDHTGGNANLAGQGAIVIAHENVRRRMVNPQDRGGGNILPASPFLAMPEITFKDQMTVYLDSLQSMHLMHVDASHTDGDAYIYFPENNVIHMGDNFVDGYPFIDVRFGGDIDGLIRNLNMALFIVDDQTRIIPGHGPVMGREELQAYRDMIMTIRRRVKQARDAGKSLEEAQQMGLTAEWDAKYDSGFINSARLVEAVYNTVDAARE